MSDLVQRLRFFGDSFNGTCAEAADEIERLRAEFEKARAFKRQRVKRRPLRADAQLDMSIKNG